jgi:5-methylcytosine-specific restriction endonuclease McrA
MGFAGAYVRVGQKKYVRWNPAAEALLGLISDMDLAKLMGLPPNKNGEGRVRHRRVLLGIPAYRTSLHRDLACGNCGTPIRRRMRDVRKRRKLYCSRDCAAAGQKTRDTERLIYGPGWKERREEIRSRDRVCRCCGRTPEQNGAAPHVHHLKPRRFGGTNEASNLVALCESCHHQIEAITTQALSSLLLQVQLRGPTLEIQLQGQVLWKGRVPNAEGSPSHTRAWEPA